MRLALAAVTVVVMAFAVTGIGMGQAPAEREAVPGPAAVAAAEQRIAAGGQAAARGRTLFEAQGCDSCHSIAAVGAEGKLGPRLDTLDDDADDIVEAITEPREDIVDGYPERLMPADYAQHMNDSEIQALAAFVAAASGSRCGRGRGGRRRRELRAGQRPRARRELRSRSRARRRLTGPAATRCPTARHASCARGP